MSQRKKWCECCKLLIPFDRAVKKKLLSITKQSIRDHENSHKHKQNHERSLREQNKKARKEKKNFSSYNPRDQKQEEQQQPEQNEFEHNYWAEQEDKTKVVKDMDAFFNEGKIWILEREDDTGRLRFRNTISGELKYEKPVGLQLDEIEQEAWDEAQLNQVQGPTISQNQLVRIGQWEVVKPEESFLQKYQASEDEDSEIDAEGLQLEKKEGLFDLVEQKVKSGKITTQTELVKVCE